MSKVASPCRYQIETIVNPTIAHLWRSEEIGVIISDCYTIWSNFILLLTLLCSPLYCLRKCAKLGDAFLSEPFAGLKLMCAKNSKPYVWKHKVQFKLQPKRHLLRSRFVKFRSSFFLNNNQRVHVNVMIYFVTRNTAVVVGNLRGHQGVGSYWIFDYVLWTNLWSRWLVEKTFWTGEVVAKVFNLYLLLTFNRT